MFYKFVIKQINFMRIVWQRKYIRRLVYLLVLIFVLINIITISHAYKFTHFSINKDQVRTSSPGKLTFYKKLKTLLLGVNNPKPFSKIDRPKDFSVKKLKSNVDIEIWENMIPGSKGIVLLFHGYSAEKSSLLKNAEFFRTLGYSTILVDFMGCGNSAGEQTTIGYYEADNVVTVYNYAKELSDVIILYGHSMGSASIMRAVSQYKINPDKIILECPFGSMQQTVENRFENMKVPIFPMSYFLTFWGGIINGFWAFDHNPNDYAKTITQPTLLMYGARDNNVKRVEIDTIYNHLISKDKALKIFEEAGHENYAEKFSQEWQNSIFRFLNTSAP